MMTSAEIRQSFIDFFSARDHRFVPGVPVVPHQDPSILFTNAGMNQFKDVFLGSGTRPYTRAVNSQICIRVSGKHNDLEDVGFDHTHLTSFEMLGNWSFGDYGKKEAIQWAWEWVTGTLNFDKSKLYAAVYEPDHESRKLWETETDIGVDHIFGCGAADNFWEMAASGPCGPCSEIHYDRGVDACDRVGIPHRCEVNGDCARFVELWNLVFIESNRLLTGELDALPARHVDTGAGLERISAIIQGVDSVYRTDLFHPIISQIVAISGVPYTDGPDGMPHRVIADHIRTLVVGIFDNVRPSNEGRGYVLRRILRRAARYVRKLGIEGAVLSGLVPIVAALLEPVLPDIMGRVPRIQAVIESEERQFGKTVDRGVGLLEERMADIISRGDTIVSGDVAFQLYDTFGFPLDLTQLMAKERGLGVDEGAFERLLDAQKSRSRAASRSTAFVAAETDLAEYPESYFTEPVESGIYRSTYLNTLGGGEVELAFSDDERLAIARHHTGTHLLHMALRSVLGAHVEQAGSAVESGRLRFDFSHFSPISENDLEKIHGIIHSAIDADLPVIAKFSDIDSAKSMGAMALFGEKYGERVRVISIGDVSMELCGGHHVQRTGLLEDFMIISESAISAGTRRIEAIVGAENVAKWRELQRQKRVAELTKKYDQLDQKRLYYSEIKQDIFSPVERDFDGNMATLAHMMTAVQEQIRDIDHLIREMQCVLATVLMGKWECGPDNRLTVVLVSDEDPAILRFAVDQWVAQFPWGCLVVGFCGERAGFIVRSGKQSAYAANEILTQLCTISGGKGGGTATFAQAGAQSDKIAMALERMKMDFRL